MKASTSVKQPKVLVLVKQTSFQTFVLDRKDARTIGLLRDGDAAVKRMRASHDSHEATVREVREALEKLGADVTVRIGLEKIGTAGYSLVVTVGGDGTLLLASHGVGPDTPLVGINSAPDSSVGFFCAGKHGTAEATLRAALSGDLPPTKLTRMQVELNDIVLHKRVLNDALFCHASPAATSRYILTLKSSHEAKVRVEEQRSSGLWVGPPAGSTAAQRSAGGHVIPLRSKALQFVVREAYVREGKRSRLLRGLIRDGGELLIKSKMMDARLFLDGIHTVHTIAIGDVIRLHRSDEGLTVLGLRR